MYDALIVGGGPGGYVAAIRIAQLGGRAAIVEQGEVGGTCLHRGCIPTKALIAAADTVRSIARAGEFGIETGQPTVHFDKVQARKAEVVSKLCQGIQQLLQKHKVDVLHGVARITGKNSIEVDCDGQKQKAEARNIIIATGSSPSLIRALGYNGKTVITSEEALQLPQIPASLLIIGAGVIGCEFAYLYNTLGTAITMVDVAPNILPMMDPDMSKRLQMSFKKKNITIKTGTGIQAITETEQGIVATLTTGETVCAEKALISVGRRLNTGSLGLETIGVALGEKGEILVNDKMETNIPGVYAVGDVVNIYQLAHVASAQGLTAAANVMGKASRMRYDAVPSCVFTAPQLASVGLSEREAKSKAIPVAVGRFHFMANGKALAMGEGEGIVKIIAHKDSDVVLGVHILGPHASDLIAEGALAVQQKITAAELAAVIHAHPTLAETLMEAAENIHGCAIHG